MPVSIDYGNKMRGDKNIWGVAPRMPEEFYMLPDAEPGLAEMLGGGGGNMSFRMGSNYRQGFNPNDFPTKLDPLAGPSYGLPSIWQGDMTTAETNAWANSMKTNENIPQFMQNTFTDPMAERMGKGVYNMDFNNPKNRPAEQLTPAYAAAAAAHEQTLASRPKKETKSYQQLLKESGTALGPKPGVNYGVKKKPTSTYRPTVGSSGWSR